MTTWKKFTYICYPENCDSLVEVTSKKVPAFTNCPVCGNNLQFIQEDETGVR